MIKEIFLLLKIKFFSLKNLIKSFSFWKKTLIPFIFGLFLFIFLFLVFNRIFSFLSKIPVLGVLISQKFLDFTFLGIFFFLTLSSIIASFSTFFEDKELIFLQNFPLKQESIYFLKFLEIFIFSSWAPLIFLLPLIISFILNFKPGPNFLIHLPFTFFFYILSSSLTGIFIFVIFIKIFPFLRREILTIFFSFLFLLFIFVYFKYFNPEIFKVFDAKSLKEAALILKRAGTLSPAFLPSSWFFSIFTGTKNPFLILLLYISYISLLLTFLLQINFYKIQNKSFLLKGMRGKRDFNLILIKKELKNFYRNYVQVTQFIFLLLLVVLYVVSIRGKGIALNIKIWHILISYANFIFISYLLITLSVRFIYTYPSLENKGISLYYVTGQNLTKIFLLQLSLFYIPLFFIGYIAFFLTHFSLKVNLEKEITYMMGFSLPLIIFLIVLISLSTGYLFPQFEEKDPTKIASSPGAFFSATILIFYLILTFIILIQPALKNYYFASNLDYLNSYIFFLLLSIFLIFVFSFITSKTLKYLEF